MAIITNLQVGLNMNASTAQIFAVEPFVASTTLFSSMMEFRHIVEDQQGNEYIISNLFQRMDDYSGLYTDRILYDSNMNMLGQVTAITNVGLALETNNDPLLISFQQIFARDDIINGSPFDDQAIGMSGNDLIYGNDGNDLIYGNQDSDSLFGNNGDDTLYSGQHADAAWGGDGSDVVYGNLADDQIYGEAGNDTLYGGQDQDLLFGGTGDDQLDGNRGNDTLQGDTGNDIFQFSSNGGVDHIVDFQDGADLIAVQSNINGGGILTAGDAVNAASQVGADVVIDLAAGNSVTISNISIGAIDESDFLIF